MQSKTVSGKKINRIFERVTPCSRDNGYFKQVCTLAMYALGAIRRLWLGRSCFILRYVPDLCQILSFETTAQKAVVTDTYKFVRNERKYPKGECPRGHSLSEPRQRPVILVFKRYFVLVYIDDTMIRDRYLVAVSTKISNDVFGIKKGLLGVYNPLFFE